MTGYAIEFTRGGVTETVFTEQTANLIQIVLNPNEVIVPDAPIITTANPLPDAIVGTAYTVTLNVIGGFSPYTWTVASGTLPVGLSMSSGGVISGTPTGFGTSTFTLSVMALSGQTASKFFSLSVAAVSNPDYGSHIGDWMVQAGDQVLIAPDRTYDAANINLALSAHAATAGTYGGWLVIKAQNPGNAIVDLAGLMMHLEGTSLGGGTPQRQLRILFVGFKFINGTIQANWMKYCRFFYCEYTFPATTWDATYIAAYQARHGGATPSHGSTLDLTAANSLVNLHPTVVNGDQSNNFEFYFCDFHNIGDDAVYIASCDSWKFVGCRWWDIYHHAINYESSSIFPMHSDAIQVNGGVTNLTVHDSSIGGHLDIETTAGAGSVTLDINNFWQYGSDHFGITLAEEGSHHITGNIKGGQWFCNYQYNGPSDYQDTPRYDEARFGTYTIGPLTLAFNDRIGYGFNAAHPDGDTTGVPNVHWLDSGNSDIGLVAANAAWHAYPSGVTQPLPAGILAPDLSGFPTAPYPNTPTVYNHTSNPAVVARAASGHAVTDWATYFSGNWP